MWEILNKDPRSLFLLGAISVCAFGAVVLLILTFRPRQLVKGIDLEPLTSRGHLGSRREELLETNFLYRIFHPVIRYIAFFIGKVPIEGRRHKLHQKLLTAGNPGAFKPDEFLAIVVIAATAMPIFVFIMMQAVLGDWHPIGMFAGMVFGIVYPFIWLSDAMTRRAKKINRALPYTLDLLTLSIEAGLDFIAAVERIVTKRRSRGPLSEEFFQMLQELKMGKTRREALRDMAARVNLDNLNSVVAALIQADQLGTSLGPVLRIQAEMLRLRRSQRAEKLAMEAPVKMLFPLLFIFTCVFLLLFGPVIVKAMRGALF